MLQTDPSLYTDVSKEDFDRFKAAAKVRGMNISGTSDNVEFDHIPVHVEYKADAKTLQFTVTEPHWLAPGVTLGALHQLVATAMNPSAVSPAVENPAVSHIPATQVKAAPAVQPAKAYPHGAPLHT